MLKLKLVQMTSNLMKKKNRIYMFNLWNSPKKLSFNADNYVLFMYCQV